MDILWKATAFIVLLVFLKVFFTFSLILFCYTQFYALFNKHSSTVTIGIEETYFLSKLSFARCKSLRVFLEHNGL